MKLAKSQWFGVYQPASLIYTNRPPRVVPNFTSEAHIPQQSIHAKAKTYKGNDGDRIQRVPISLGDVRAFLPEYNLERLDVGYVCADLR